MAQMNPSLVPGCFLTAFSAYTNPPSTMPFIMLNAVMGMYMCIHTKKVEIEGWTAFEISPKLNSIQVGRQDVAPMDVPALPPLVLSQVSTVVTGALQKQSTAWVPSLADVRGRPGWSLFQFENNTYVAHNA